MLTDLDVDHGVDHVDHMGTETWRCQEVTRIERYLDEGEPLMGDIGEPIRHIELEPVEAPFEVPVENPEKVPA